MESTLCNGNRINDFYLGHDSLGNPNITYSGNGDTSTAEVEQALKILTEKAGLAISNLERIAQPSSSSQRSSIDINDRKALHTFESLVEDYMAKHDCSKGKAIVPVAKSNRAEHQAYLERLRSKPKTLKSLPKNLSAFESLVEDYMAKHDCSKGRAIVPVAKSNRAEHQEFISITNKQPRKF